ncbi:hypothetical protein M9H77_17048 [Catharanthus roseus]|uniref:Uncharacterized protein n=1 Tax=Catharanthus roseus TaxID=4058 RepID=A0ACC0B3G4_CATRO|nr:hypothetical protein M9H77_17048 [Catharanthus roseus]
MDVEVIDSEDGNMGQRGSITDDGDDDPHEIGELNEDGLVEPHVGMEFDSEDSAKSFYDEYARRVGFSTRVGHYSRSSGMVTAREFLCSRDGLKRRAGDSCDALLRIELRGHGKWVVTRFVKEHSHSTVNPGKVQSLRPRRHFAGAVKHNAETYSGTGTVPSGVMYVSMDGNCIPADTNRRAKSSSYERAIESSFEKEVEADSDTTRTSPVLKTPSPMEKQAASFYTRRIFSKFQEELVETFVYTANRIDGDGVISTFRVAKFEDDQKAYIVSLNVADMKASCSCQMFEFSGILCRHVLTVFTVTNVLTLPSHYILKRWTRHARTGFGSEDCGEVHCHESLTTRYNSLCREAIRYAEEGAITPETYDIVLSALKEAGKKIAAVKKNVAKAVPPSLHGVGYDDHRTLIYAPDTTPLLWPRQDEMIKRFNLNDVGASTQSGDMNLPRMAPTSVQRGDGASDNMLILPCLKSMTWVMENKNSTPANRVAVINLKLQDYSRNPSGESEVKFHLSKVTLEPMLRSMAFISEQLSTPANRVAVINLKLQDTEATSGESEVKFQVSRDTLGAMLRSMAYIREQLSIPVSTLCLPQQIYDSRIRVPNI